MIKYLSFLLLLLSICITQAEEAYVDPEEVKENALRIDKIVAENFRNNKIEVPDVTNDATFLRRSFLVSAGRIPTARETLDFLELEHPDKRALMVNYLISSDGYRSHMTNWMYDLLTLRESHGNGPNRKSNSRLIEWVRISVEENHPWDEFATSLLSTRGNAWTSPGAAGYYDKGDAIDDHLSNTLRVFTGIRMECAQCHDDPFQEWEQMDFFQLKAFVDGPVGIKTKANLQSLSRTFRTLEENESDKYRKNHVGRLSNLHGAVMGRVTHGTDPKRGAGRVKIPKDYQYNDADPGEMVGGRTPYGFKARTSDSEYDYESLNKFASWIVNDKTPHFSQTISLRLWEKIMGISLTPTTGDYIAPEDTEFKKLILVLMDIMQDYDYNVKAFQQTLMMTKTFQFVSSKKDLINGSERALDGRRANRMSAEQIWDSLLSLVAVNPDALPKRNTSTFNFNFAGQSIMTNLELVNKVNGMSEEQYEKFILNTYEKLREKEFPTTDEEDYASHRNRTNVTALKRASELPTPAPIGHFLSVFGQSRRSAAIDEASKEGTVSQALEILNGIIQKEIVHNNDAIINQVIDQTSGAENKIRTIFLVVLNRAPTSEEFEFCKSLLDESHDEKDFCRNLVAGLVTSQEFYFIF